MKELRLISTDNLELGSRLLAIRETFEEGFTVVEYRPPSWHMIEGGIRRLTTKIGFHLEPADSGTRVEMNFSWQLRGIWKLAAPFFTAS